MCTELSTPSRQVMGAFSPAWPPPPQPPGDRFPAPAATSMLSPLAEQAQIDQGLSMSMYSFTRCSRSNRSSDVRKANPFPFSLGILPLRYPCP